MSGLESRVRTLEHKMPDPDRLVLIQRTTGEYVQLGTGQTYTQSQVDALGDDVTVISFRIVYHDTPRRVEP